MSLPEEAGSSIAKDFELEAKVQAVVRVLRCALRSPLTDVSEGDQVGRH